MVLAEIVFAGKFDAGDKKRVSGRKKIHHDLSARYRIMVGDRKVSDTGAFDDGKELFGSIGPVGDRGVHMKIDPTGKCHGCAVLSHFLFHDTKTSDAESTAQMPKSEKAGAGILVHLLCIEL